MSAIILKFFNIIFKNLKLPLLRPALTPLPNGRIMMLFKLLSLCFAMPEITVLLPRGSEHQMSIN